MSEVPMYNSLLASERRYHPSSRSAAALSRYHTRVMEYAYA